MIYLLEHKLARHFMVILLHRIIIKGAIIEYWFALVKF